MADDASVFVSIVVYLVLLSTVLGYTFEDEITQIDIAPTFNLDYSENNLTLISNMSEIEHKAGTGLWRTETGRGIFSVVNGTDLDYRDDNIIRVWVPKYQEGDLPYILKANDISFPVEKSDIHDLSVSIENLEERDFILTGVYARKGQAVGFFVCPEDNTITLAGYDVGNYEVYNYDLSANSYDFRIYTDLDNSRVKLYVDDELLIDKLIELSWYQKNIAGIFAENSVFRVISFGSEVEITDLSIISTKSLDLDASSGYGIQDFIRIVGVLFVWNISPDLMPWSLNILIIKVPLFILLFVFIRTLRGN